jgi:hypothetical protein
MTLYANVKKITQYTRKEGRENGLSSVPTILFDKKFESTAIRKNKPGSSNPSARPLLGQ